MMGARRSPQLTIQGSVQTRGPRWSLSWDIAESLERQRGWNSRNRELQRGELLTERTLETCRGSPSSVQQGTYQCMHVRKLPGAREGPIWKNERMVLWTHPEPETDAAAHSQTTKTQPTVHWLQYSGRSCLSSGGKPILNRTLLQTCLIKSKIPNDQTVSK